MNGQANQNTRSIVLMSIERLTEWPLEPNIHVLNFREAVAKYRRPLNTRNQPYRLTGGTAGAPVFVKIHAISGRNLCIIKNCNVSQSDFRRKVGGQLHILTIQHERNCQ